MRRTRALSPESVSKKEDKTLTSKDIAGYPEKTFHTQSQARGSENLKPPLPSTTIPSPKISGSVSDTETRSVKKGSLILGAAKNVVGGLLGSKSSSYKKPKVLLATL